MKQEFKFLLRSSKFLNLWTSQILSQVTVQMMNFLLLAKLFAETGSSIATALLWVAYALPAIFFGPIGAASVDLVSRRKMLMWTNLLQALTVFGYIFTHQHSIFLLYFVVVAYSFFNQFYVPAENASLPSLVSKNNLTKANSLFFITQQFALIVGFGFAGLLQGFLGFNGSLIICSIFLFTAFISVSFLPEIKPRVKVPLVFDKFLITFFKTILEGYQFIKGKKYILLPLMLLLGIQVALAVIVVNLPVLADQILNVSIVYSGLIIVIPAGLGAIIGSLFVNKYSKEGLRKKITIEYSLGLLALTIGLMVFVLPQLPLDLRLILGPFLTILIGFGFIGVNIPTITFLQEVTPVWLRGRVFGNLWFLVTIATIFPVIFSGFITEFFGVKSLLVLFMVAIVMVLIYSHKKGQKLIEQSFENE